MHAKKKLFLFLFRVLAMAMVMILSSFQKTPSEIDNQSIDAPASSKKEKSDDLQAAEKIKNFLEKEKTHLSKEFPYLLNLFKDGSTAKNKAGIRISETPQSFPIMEKNPATRLSGLLFYYSLFDHAMRVPHWHANAVEMGFVLNGRMKITIWDGPGNFSHFIVDKGGAWMIPKAAVHCLENVGDDQLNFLVTYDSPYAEDRDFATAWAALPEAILEKSLALSSKDIDDLKTTTKNRLSLYDPDANPTVKEQSSPYSILFSEINPIYSSPLGSIKRVDETNWPAMKFMAMNQTILKPASIREPHWYTSGDVLFFVNQGEAYFTLLDDNGDVYHSIVKRGDLISIPVGTFHTYVNIGNEDLEVYESFNRSGPLKEIGILDASQHFKPGTLSGATGVSVESIQKILKTETHVYMRSL